MPARAPQSLWKEYEQSLYEARTHPLPDISNLESYPTPEFGFDTGLFIA